MVFPEIKEPALDYLLKQVKLIKPSKILEIGTCRGYSGSKMLGVCEKSKLITMELNESNALLAEQNFGELGLSDRVQIIKGDATQSLINLCELNSNNNSFDLCFLDGAKGQYVYQLPFILKLLKPGGTLIADNVLFRGYIENPTLAPKRFKTIVKRMNEFIVECKKQMQNVEIMRVGDGVLYATKY